MPPIPPTGVKQSIQPQISHRKSDELTVEDKVDNIGRKQLNREVPSADDDFNSSSVEENKEFAQKIKQRLIDFGESLKEFGIEYTHSTGSLEFDASNLLTTAINHLEDRILRISDGSSQVAQASQLPPMTLLLKEATVSNLKMKTALRKDEDNDLKPIFADDFISSIMLSLSERHPDYFGCKNEASICQEIYQYYDSTFINPGISQNVSFTSLSSRSQESIERASEKFKTDIAEYWKQYERTLIKNGNEKTLSGSSDEGISRLLELASDSNTSVIVLGEGSHQEYALDQILVHPELPQKLLENGIKVVLAEHIYPEHVNCLREIDCSSVFNHLLSSGFGVSSKALNYVQFLRLCSRVGIEVIAADSVDIYRPQGVKLDNYNVTARLERLNDNISKLVRQNKDKGKILILVGAAHTNHLNADKSRADLDEEVRPTNTTPGIVEIIPEAEELILQTNFNETAAKERGQKQLASIKNGSVFRLTVREEK